MRSPRLPPWASRKCRAASLSRQNSTLSAKRPCKIATSDGRMHVHLSLRPIGFRPERLRRSLFRRNVPGFERETRAVESCSITTEIARLALSSPSRWLVVRSTIMVSLSIRPGMSLTDEKGWRPWHMKEESCCAEKESKVRAVSAGSRPSSPPRPTPPKGNFGLVAHRAVTTGDAGRRDVGWPWERPCWA